MKERKSVEIEANKGINTPERHNEEYSGSTKQKIFKIKEGKTDRVERRKRQISRKGPHQTHSERLMELLVRKPAPADGNQLCRTLHSNAEDRDSKYRRMETVSDHRNQTRKWYQKLSQKSWKLTYFYLNKDARESLKIHFKNYIHMKENENVPHAIWNTAKARLRTKCKALNAYMRKEENS